MNKKENKKIEKYPIELPSYNQTIKREPIVDVADNEIFPLELGNHHHIIGDSHQSYDNISEVIATETTTDLG